MNNAILNYILRKLAERSTWGGLVGMFPALAAHASLISHIGYVLACVALVVVDEQRKLTPMVVVEDVANAVSNSVVVGPASVSD